MDAKPENHMQVIPAGKPLATARALLTHRRIAVLIPGGEIEARKHLSNLHVVFSRARNQQIPLRKIPKFRVTSNIGSLIIDPESNIATLKLELRIKKTTISMEQISLLFQDLEETETETEKEKEPALAAG